MERFFCPNLELGVLTDAESRHCLQVLRHKLQDHLLLFDGRGREWEVEISNISGKRVYFTKVAETTSQKPPTVICLIQAVPKGKAMDFILQKATELGVAEIVPITSERTVTRVADDWAGDKVEGWRETVVEAGKQSGQNWLPIISPVQKLKDFLKVDRPGIKLIASLQPGARPLKETVKMLLGTNFPVEQISILIGPEGDFSSLEIEQALAQGYLPVTLGELILRVETAALYLVSILKYESETLR